MLERRTVVGRAGATRVVLEPEVLDGRERHRDVVRRRVVLLQALGADRQVRVLHRVAARVDHGDVVAERGQGERDGALRAADVEDATRSEPHLGEDPRLLDDPLVDEQHADPALPMLERHRRVEPQPGLRGVAVRSVGPGERRGDRR